MAMRLADSVIEGYFNNLKGKSTHGILALEGWEMPIHFSLAGDAAASLAGRSFSFRRSPSSPAIPMAEGAIAAMQIGAVGTMELRMAKIPLGDFAEACAEGRPIEFEWMPLLYLEWFGQNGRIVVELDNPVVLLEHGEPFEELEVCDDSMPAGFSISAVEMDDGIAVARNFVLPEEADPEVDGDIDAHLDRLNREKEAAMRGDGDFEREMELGERLIEAERGEFLASLLSPGQLPAVDGIDEDSARGHVLSLVGELALFNVAVHLCPHCTWGSAYRYIVEELLHEGRVPPEIRGSGWTMNYDYGESCSECIAEIEKSFRERNPDLRSFGDGGGEVDAGA